MFNYLVADEDGGITGLDDLELAKAIAEFDIVIDVQAGTTIMPDGSKESEIISWTARFPYATVDNPWADRLEEDTELSSRTAIDAGDESFPGKRD